MPKYLYKPDQYSSHSRILNSVIKFAKARKLKILDVGCATGFLARELKKEGHQVVGIEVDKEAAKEAKKYCSKIIVDSAESGKIKFKKEYFDVIILGDILEHLKEPLLVLSKYKEYLKPGGLIISSTGNIANWHVRLNLLFGRFEYKEKGILDKTHLRFYTKKTFKKLMRDAGLKIVDIKATPIPLPMLAQMTAKGKPLNFIHQLNYLVTLLWKNIFAFQFVIIAKKTT